MWRHILRESEGGRDDVFVQQVDIIALRIGGVVVKRKIAGEHGVLKKRY
jgi:hypothetical protein